MTTDVRAEIAAVNAQFVDGAGRGDVEAMGGVYTSETVLEGAAGEALVGRHSRILQRAQTECLIAVGVPC